MEADIIIVATPYGDEKEVAEKIREVATGKVVISISNPLNSSYNVTGHECRRRTAKTSPILESGKNIQYTFAADFVMPVIDGKTAEAFIAGNNSDAVETVSEIIKTAGFNPVVVGDLTVSRALERMQLLLTQLIMKNNYNLVAGWK